MMTIKHIKTTVFFLALLCSSVCHGADYQVSKPDWLKLTEVSPDMEVMGVPSAVYLFSGAYDIEKILKYYRQKWRTVKVDSIKDEYIEPWYILTTLKDNHLYTLQIKTEGALLVRGYLAIADVGTLPKNRGRAQLPAIAGSQVINDSQMNDLGKKGRLVLLSNSHTVSVNHSYYKNHYNTQGWQTEVNRQTQDNSVQIFRSANREIHIVISHQYGKTQVVLNLVEN